MSHGKGIASSSHFTSKVSDAPHKDVLEKMQILLACEAACTNCADRAIEVRSPSPLSENLLI